MLIGMVSFFVPAMTIWRCWMLLAFMNGTNVSGMSLSTSVLVVVLVLRVSLVWEALKGLHDGLQAKLLQIWVVSLLGITASVDTRDDDAKVLRLARNLVILS